jgi:hypothetical protein
MFIGPQLVTDQLVFSLDAANTKSYPGSGTTWKDLSGGGHDGTLEGGITWDSENGGYWDLDGSDDHLQIPYDSYWDNNVFGTATVATIMCWTKCDNFFNYSCLIQKANTGGEYNRSEGISLWSRTGPDRFQAVYGRGKDNDDGGHRIISYEVTDLTKWYHVAATIDGSDVKLYIDGALEATGTQPDTVSPNTGTNGPRIGKRQGGGNYDGQISNVQLYTKALSASEILHNYNALKSRFI